MASPSHESGGTDGSETTTTTALSGAQRRKMSVPHSFKRRKVDHQNGEVVNLEEDDERRSSNGSEAAVDVADDGLVAEDHDAPMTRRDLRRLEAKTDYLTHQVRRA